jgi:hypothetical protein
LVEPEPEPLPDPEPEPEPPEPEPSSLQAAIENVRAAAIRVAAAVRRVVLRDIGPASLVGLTRA